MKMRMNMKVNMELIMEKRVREKNQKSFIRLKAMNSSANGKYGKTTGLTKTVLNIGL